MRIITWDSVNIGEIVSELDSLARLNQLRANIVNNDDFDIDTIGTEDAILLIKHSLMGELHGILVFCEEELLTDAEIYLLTWDGEASDGGEMQRITPLDIYNIARGEFTLK